MPRVMPDELLRLATELVARLGATPEDAHTVAEHLVDAQLAGHDSHGVIRLVQYAAHVREGRIVPAAAVRVIREGSATALLDGNAAWGQVVAREAVDRALSKVREVGCAAIAVRNSYHIGRVGVYPQRIAEAGYTAVLFCNGYGVARVAPWGGREARLATNPIAIAVPTRTRPVVVDVTTSVVAEGKVRVAKNAGKAIPEGWVLDRDGESTTDPAKLYDGGTLLPLGGREGHKGYGLSVIVDLLGGVLTGAGCGFMTESVGNGFFLQVADPASFGDREEFLDRVEAYLAYLRSSPALPGREVLLPGEPEERTSARRRGEGIDIDSRTWEQLAQLAEEPV